MIFRKKKYLELLKKYHMTVDRGYWFGYLDALVGYEIISQKCYDEIKIEINKTYQKETNILLRGKQ